MELTVSYIRRLIALASQAQVVHSESATPIAMSSAGLTVRFQPQLDSDSDATNAVNSLQMYVKQAARALMGRKSHDDVIRDCPSHSQRRVPTQKHFFFKFGERLSSPWNQNAISILMDYTRSSKQLEVLEKDLYRAAVRHVRYLQHQYHFRKQVPAMLRTSEQKRASRKYAVSGYLFDSLRKLTVSARRRYELE